MRLPASTYVRASCISTPSTGRSPSFRADRSRIGRDAPGRTARPHLQLGQPELRHAAVERRHARSATALELALGLAAACPISSEQRGRAVPRQPFRRRSTDTLAAPGELRQGRLVARLLGRETAGGRRRRRGLSRLRRRGRRHDGACRRSSPRPAAHCAFAWPCSSRQAKNAPTPAATATTASQQAAPSCGPGGVQALARGPRRAATSFVLS